LAASCACLLALVFSVSAQAAGGTVAGWGYNEYGEASGVPSSTSVKTPTVVPGVSGVVQVAPGGYHTLALLSNGTAISWGYNVEGQLGNGTVTESTTPVQVSGLSNAVAVASDYYSSIALLSNGTVMAWGYNNYGELGDGSITGPEECNTYSCSKVPVPVPGLSNVIAIAGNGEHFLALLGDGTVMGWGYDYHGDLGDGTGVQTGCECVDHPVSVPGLSDAVAISIGELQASALLAGGTVKAWGDNEYGYLGTGVETTSGGCECLGPVTVNGISGATAVASGDIHGLALLADGTVKGWGYDYYGAATGIANTTSSPCYCAPGALQVAGLPQTQAISAGAYYNSIALMADGTVRAWGYNEYGELGDGTKTEHAPPAPANGLSGVSDISTGNYSVFALIGPSQTLNVSLAGAGAGVVGTQGLVCPSACSGRFPQGRVVILRPAPSPGSGFAGFSGPCTGTGPCQVKMESDQTLTATFGPPKGTAITKSKVKESKSKKGKAKLPRKATAGFSFSAPGAITGYQCALVKPATKKKKHHPAKASAAAKPKFSACSSHKAYKNLKPGKYTFKVRAVDILGVDAKPAVKKFTVRP
jgi:alpha-tubulin suppressor-like RCC1 family protein